MTYPRMASLKSPEDLRRRLSELQIYLPFDEEIQSGPASPLAQSLAWSGGTIGNRFAILPMEGWDGTRDGKPSELTHRRWNRFGASGAKLIWGGEAVAVRENGRANPHQLVLNSPNQSALADLRQSLIDSHRKSFGQTEDLLVGLQLTHSGRYSRPNPDKRLEPLIAYRHPYLDSRTGIVDDQFVLSDADLARLTDDFVQAARLAWQIGFAFVDIKHCHGYLGHELLSAYDRPGRYGGCFENRTRFLRDIVSGIRSTVPGLAMGVRLSVFDWIPFHKESDGVGVADSTGPYRYAFGGNGTGVGIDLEEPDRFLQLLTDLGIELVCLSAGNPYACPHIVRPAFFPPSDGYLPPEDPLVGSARLINTAAQLKQRHPRLCLVGSGYSYLQDWLPHVAQRMVREGKIDSVGLGRMVLSYPELPADVLAGQPLQRKRICRTFSDCTSGPRNGLISGCYPLDPFYKVRPEYTQLQLLEKHNP